MSDSIQVLTVRCKVGGTDADRGEMFASMRAFGDACQFVTDNTDPKLVNEGRLRKSCYLSIREKFGLSSNIAQQVISRVSANRKAARTTGGTVTTYGAGSVQFDERTFCLYGETASLTLLNGRRRIPLVLGDYQRNQLVRHIGAEYARKDTGEVANRRIRSAQLNARRSRKGRMEIYLNIQIEVACAGPIDPVDCIGVDLGRRDIAHTSNGRAFAGNHRKVIRDRFHRVRRSLQSKASKGTRSTRRRCREVLQRLSGRERRFQAAENHVISKTIVQDASEMRASTCFEDLTGIRNRTDVPRAMRRDHHGWSFHQLRTDVEYKAKVAGVPFNLANPAYTSQTCHGCDCIGTRRGKFFACNRFAWSCGWTGDADWNASQVIRSLGMSVTHPGTGPFCRLPNPAVQG